MSTVFRLWKRTGTLYFLKKTISKLFRVLIKKDELFPNLSNPKFENIKVDYIYKPSTKKSKSVTMTISHEDGSSEDFQVNHTLNDDQVKWFNAGSALNYMGSK